MLLRCSLVCREGGGAPVGYGIHISGYLPGVGNSPPGKSVFIPNSSVSGVPKNSADTRCPGSEFRQTPASHELWPVGDLFPSADKRSSFARWLGATHRRQKPVDHRKSPMPLACIWKTDRGLPSVPNAPVAPCPAASPFAGGRCSKHGSSSGRP